MILVAGATGSLGSKIVRGLLERGDPVRALVRKGSNYQTLRDAGASLVFGDLRDPASLVEACRGVDVVISTASASNRSDDIPENVDGRGTQNLIDAAKAAGVQHFILMSTISAAPDSPVPVFRAKAETESHLKQSGLDYTIIHATGFMDVWFGMFLDFPIASGLPVTLVGESRRRHAFIAERDVSAFILAAVRNPAARNRTLPIGGPAAVTFNEVVAAYEAALGRAITVNRIKPGDPIPGLPEPVWGIAASLELFDSIVPMEETARMLGVTMTSVQDFARERMHSLPSPSPQS